jgi:trehalose 6-phosphate synthase
VILANREPYMHVKANGGSKVIHPASGLVTALEPVMRACGGVWVAHGSGSADRETVDLQDRIPVPPGEGSYLLRRVWLTEAEENGYYYGFANEGLWPLCHVAHARPVFRAEDWAHYVGVNRKFADAVCQEVDRDDPIVLVQDYHFALAPRMIRDTLPRATIITFWHIPWPNAERIGICPWREEIISGLLGSSVVGFHTQLHCNNFIDSVDAFMESRIDRESTAVVQGGRRTLVRPYPISIEWPVRWLEAAVPIPQARADVRRELGLAPDALLGVGVDRLDYTKGIEERLCAVDELLRRYPEYRNRFTFLQLAAPSRTKIDRYRELNERVKALSESINDKWGVGTYRPIVLLQQHHEPSTVFRYYRAADLCYVSSLDDGMNLVAKEFVAARDDERGVLVLSQFTGAARDLTEALVVNPYDLGQASDALAMALRMPDDEQRERMKSMRRLVSEFNVYRWAGRMIVDAAELRRRERISGRLSSVLALKGGEA